MRTDPIRGFLSIFSSNLVRLLLGIAITPILVRVLGTANYGDYAFILSILGVSMILVNAGITDGLRKFVAEDRDRAGWADAVYGFYVQTGTILAGIAALGFVAANLAGVTESLLGPVFVPYLYLLAGVIVVRQGENIVRSSLMGKGLEHLSEPLWALQKLLFGIFGISLAYVGYDVSGVVAGHLIAGAIVLVVGTYLLSFHYDIRAAFRPKRVHVPRRELLTFNAHSVMLILLTASLYHVDIILLQWFVGSEATGLYKAALIVAEFLWFVPFALQMVLLHSASELWAKEETARISEIAARVARYTLFFTVLVATGIAALAEPFVGLYFGDEFTPAVLPLWLLLPGALGFAIARPIFAIGQGAGMLQPLILATAAAALLNLGLNLVLIPPYGMAGAAVATSIGYASMLGFHVVAARSIGYNPVADLRLFRVGSTVSVSAVVIGGLAMATGPSLVSLVVVPPVGFVVYTVLGLRLRAVDPAELIGLAERLPDSIRPRCIRLIQYVG